MIFGGVEVNRVTILAVKKTKISVTHGKRVREASEDDEITFTEEDVDGLILLHNDALVISLHVLNFKIKRVLVDPGSSVDIILLRILEQAKLTGNIVPTTKLLVWFNLTSVSTPGEILLPTHAEGVMNTTPFEVVDGDIGYNVILGRPWIHEMKDVPLTYHQLLKFPTLDGIKKIRGDQPAVRKMNIVTFSSSKVPEETDATKSTAEKLEQIALFIEFPDEKVYLETRYYARCECPQVKLDPNFPPMKQKKRPTAEVRNMFVKE
ncbi:uncharacterized protein [Nicotiana tomentosiformis]|uniref:uncharacterized protein n=1 Tax=Nicotiana tomentosiformis TaxID=4098 RepID=UPI00388CE142